MQVGEIETTLTEMLAKREILPAHRLTLMLILVEGNQDISSQQSNQNIRQLIRPDDTDFFPGKRTIFNILFG